MKMDRKKLIEAALFIAGKEIKREELAEMLQMDAAEVEKIVNRLQEEYSGRNSCLVIRKSGATYKMDIDQGYVEAVKRLAPEVEMTRGLLKALSFIAYKQPARQSDLVKVLGNRTYDYVKELEERGFITRERWGRSRKLETTEKFTTYFGTSAIGLEEAPGLEDGRDEDGRDKDGRDKGELEKGGRDADGRDEGELEKGNLDEDGRDEGELEKDKVE